MAKPKRPKREADPDIKRAVDLAGGAAKVAELFGIRRLSVYGWMYSGRVPIERCPGLEEACGGAVPRDRLNRDTDWKSLQKRSVGHPLESAA